MENLHFKGHLTLTLHANPLSLQESAHINVSVQKCRGKGEGEGQEVKWDSAF